MWWACWVRVTLGANTNECYIRCGLLLTEPDEVIFEFEGITRRAQVLYVIHLEAWRHNCIKILWSQIFVQRHLCLVFFVQVPIKHAGNESHIGRGMVTPLRLLKLLLYHDSPRSHMSVSFNATMAMLSFFILNTTFSVPPVYLDVFLLPHQNHIWSCQQAPSQMKCTYFV